MNDKYPYIGKSTITCKVVLFFSDSTGVVVERGNVALGKCWDESLFTNVTREYLSNTKIKVLSEEHSEMIQKLAFSVGYGWRGLGLTIRADCKYLFIYGGCDLNKSSDGIHFNAHPHKEIFLPMPESKAQSEEKPLWPCVGSTVTWGNKSVTGEVKAFSDGLAWIKNEYGNYCSEYIEQLSKPKTERDMIKRALIDYIDDSPAHVIAEEILERFNVTKK